MIVTIKVFGKVYGKPRPKVARKGGCYTNKKHKPHKEYEEKIREAYEATGREPFTGEVAVTICTYRALPKSRPAKVTSEPDTVKPDCDNIGKLVLDALNGVAYLDDSQVTLLTVSKQRRRRGVEECIRVTVEAVE